MMTPVKKNRKTPSKKEHQTLLSMNFSEDEDDEYNPEAEVIKTWSRTNLQKHYIHL